MSQPYVGETRIFAFAFAPPGWLACEGQLLPISEFEQLFQLIGTTYGGDGESVFALPNAAGPDSEGTPLTVCISLYGEFPMQ
jgi:microcystin-dependent protein